MTRFVRTVAIVLAFTSQSAFAASEIPLSNFSGQKIAYITSDETIYLWGGKPVAYLIADRTGGEDVFGFNGKHLGWFLKDTIWSHEGRPVCIARQAQPHGLEPLKAAKGAIPAKAAREAVPVRPIFVEAPEDTACHAFLNQDA
jgi:hypothetical protein